jgi:hypothetical protein
LILFSLLFLVVAVVGSGAVLGLRGLRLYRTLKAFGRAATETVGAVTEAAGRVEANAGGLSGHAERLTVAAEHLQSSVVRLAVLRGAAAEVKRSVDGVRGAVPRK